MIKTIVKDVFFLGQKSTEATKEDLYLAKDLRDTLEFHKDACVGSRPTKRYESIEVAYLDEQWMPKQLSFSGMPAQIIQHELDHLEGIII